MTRTPAELLTEAIETHRNQKYHGGTITDPLDITLYTTAVWWRTWQDHQQDPDAPIPDNW